jgi:hypothetical protein
LEYLSSRTFSFKSVNLSPNNADLTRSQVWLTFLDVSDKLQFVAGNDKLIKLIGPKLTHYPQPIELHAFARKRL